MLIEDENQFPNIIKLDVSERCQIFSWHHFISLWFEILTWFLVWECIILSYRSSLKFVLVEWFLANLQPLGFEILPVVTTKYLAKFQSPTAVSWPKIIQPERISNLICNLRLYTHIPKIKSISQIHYNLRYWLDFWFESVYW
jgi:hypothetical protein